jgi:hypothetical protein
MSDRREIRRIILPGKKLLSHFPGYLRAFERPQFFSYFRELKIEILTVTSGAA